MIAIAIAGLLLAGLALAASRRPPARRPVRVPVRVPVRDGAADRPRR